MQAERVVVEAIAQCKQPDMGGLQKLVEPVGMEIFAADKLTQGRRSAAFNYCKAVAEALPALSWVVYSGPSCGARKSHIHCGGFDMGLFEWLDA